VEKKATYGQMYAWSFSDSFMRSAEVETVAEKWILIILEIFQNLVFAAIAGFIFSKVGELRATAVAREAKMSQLKEYAEAVRLPRTLKTKVLDTFELIYENKSVFDEEDILSELPQHTRSEVVRVLHGDKIEGNMFFFGLEHNEAAVMKICMKLRSVSALMNDEVYSEGDMGEDMFFLGTGSVMITSERLYLEDKSHRKSSAVPATPTPVSRTNSVKRSLSLQPMDSSDGGGSPPGRKEDEILYISFEYAAKNVEVNNQFLRILHDGTREYEINQGGGPASPLHVVDETDYNISHYEGLRQKQHWFCGFMSKYSDCTETNFAHK
jgi:hypothetical protein